MAPWCSGYRYCTTSFNKAWTQVLCRFKSCSQRVRHLHYSNIIPLFYVDSETVKKTAAILEPWLAKAEHIKDTRNHHQFVPEGSSMRMIRISGSTTNVDNHIVNNNRMDLNDITHGPYYACKYDDLFSILSIIFPWNTVTLMWNSCTPRHLLGGLSGLTVKMSAGFPWIIWFVGLNLPPLVAQLDTIHLMKLTLIKF